jgi:hypothetical protein
MAVTLALFKSLGTCPSCIVLLNMIEIGVTSDGKIALINLGATSISTLDNASELPDLLPLSPCELSDIVITEQDVYIGS